MSAEDLGTRELGQVRSQRLDEVSFLFLSFRCFTVAVFCFTTSPSQFFKGKTIFAASR